MANYSLVIDSKFRPYSFDELVKPYMMYGQAYDEQQNQLSDLAVKSNVWKGLANEQADPTAYKMYKTYADDLESRAGVLAKEGLTPGSRKSMLDLKSRYSSEITPLENAWKAREEQRKLQEQMTAQDPTLLLSRQAATTSLDDYLKNPELSYTSYSGKLATAQVAQAAGALAKELRNYGTGKPIDAFTNTFMKKYGFSSSDVINAMNNPNDPHSSKVLRAIVDQTVGSTGIKDWNNPQALSRIEDYAKQGLWSAVGTTELNPMENFGARATFQSNLEEGRQIRAENRAATRAKQQQINSMAINPLNLYGSREQDIAAKNMNAFSKFFYRDASGKMRMNQAGLAEYRRKVLTRTGKPMTTPEGTTILTNVSKKYVASPFKHFMDSIGASKFIGNQTDKTHMDFQPGNLGSLWSRYQGAHNTSRYDTHKATEFDYSISGSQQGDMKDAILTAARGNNHPKLEEVDYDGKSGTFKSTGASLNLSDLKSDKYKVTATRFSPAGSTVMIQDKNGDVHRYRMPLGVNTYNEGNRDKIMREIPRYQQALKTGILVESNGNKVRLTPSGAARLQSEYNQMVQNAYFYHSQLGVQNKTKEQEYNPVGY